MVQKIASFFKKFWYKIIFIVTGVGSLIWFLIRVIPKPSRAAYPCMKVAAPLASSFITYILGLGTFAFIMKKAKEKFKKAKYVIAIALVFVGLVVGVVVIYNSDYRVNAQTLQDPQPVNEPVGEGKGIYPGRVVWVHNPNATNENCTNKANDYWFMDKNADQDTISAMVSTGLQELTGTSSDADAWDALFKYFNNMHGKGEVGYSSGEKIVIKINLNGLGNGWTPEPNINTSPQVCYAILDQLVNVVGVSQSDIYIGDPNIKPTSAHTGKLDAFPDINFWRSGSSVTQPTEKTLKYSDGNAPDYIPQEYIDAAYMINIPVFKKHHRAGISIAAKLHFGSITPFTGSAFHVHYSLPCPEATSIAENGEYGAYRCFVDIMGHKDMGGKTLLYLVDGIWGSTNWGHPPVKFRMTPFDNDWPSSLFIAQDPVALESVCYDFLYYEFDENHPTEGVFVGEDKGPYPHFPAADDYLHQAADPNNWPDDIDYDPEGDGTILSSLGVHEHWNDAVNKQYSRNLGTGDGIELLYVAKNNPVNPPDAIKENFEVLSNYPNPFNVNTTIKYKLSIPSSVKISIFNSSGILISTATQSNLSTGIHEYNWDASDNNGIKIPGGVYFYRINVTNSKGTFEMTDRMLYIGK